MQPRFRNILFLLCLCVVLPTIRLAAAQVAGPGSLNQKDRISALYSGMLLFDKNNEPMATIRVTDRVRTIDLDFRSGLTVRTHGPDGPEFRFRGKGRIKISLENAQPAEKAYRVRLERIPGKDFKRVLRRKRWWAKKGLQVSTVETGTVFGYHGTVLDTREFFLVATPSQPGRRAAENLARRLRDGGADQILVESWLQKLPRGNLILEIPGRKVRITSPDLIWLKSSAQKSLYVRNVIYGLKGVTRLKKEHRLLSGTFYLTADPEGMIAMGQALGVEKLLRGIVPSEIYPDAPDAALRAQAITARGDLLAKLGKRHLKDPFLICNIVHCQSYRGDGKEHRGTNRAVRATRGQVLFHGDDLVPALYHASCGGHTEPNEITWEGVIAHPALRGRRDAKGLAKPPFPRSEAGVQEFVRQAPFSYCAIPKAGRAGYRWSVKRDPAKVMKRIDPGGRLGALVDIIILERGPGGRASKVKLVGTAGSRVLAPELTIRRALGRLRSTLFHMQLKHVFSTRHQRKVVRAILIEGAGFGHGVGMCQNGAVGMSLRGLSTKDILEHYFNNASVRRLY